MRCASAMVVWSLVGCTSAPPGQLLLRIDIDASGAATSVAAQPASAARVPYARSAAEGNLTIAVLDGAGASTWEGHRDVSLVEIAETFFANGPVGSEAPAQSTTVRVLVPDPGGDRLRVRVSLDLGEAPVVTELDAIVWRGSRAAVAGLVEAGGDLAARREGLDDCTNPTSSGGCNEPEEFCHDGACRIEACLPHDAWDASLLELHAGAGLELVLFPVGWSDPESFRAFAAEITDALFAEFDWYADHESSIRVSAWNADCHIPDIPVDASDFRQVAHFVGALPDWTALAPPFDILIGVGPRGEACGGKTTAPGATVGIASCASVIESAETLAHELGHAFGGLGDEYYRPPQSTCSPSELHYPNYSANGHVRWRCRANTEGAPVFFGYACGRNNPGTVGAWDHTASCANIVHPCNASLMNFSLGSAQFDPIGYASMSHRLATGSVMTYSSCAASLCDDNCRGGVGTCGTNECGRLCDACDTGQSCTWGGAWSCGDGCSDVFSTCRDFADREVCGGDRFLVDPAGCGTGQPLFAICRGQIPRCDAECASATDDVACRAIDGCLWASCGRCVATATGEGGACPETCASNTEELFCTTAGCDWCTSACQPPGTCS